MSVLPAEDRFKIEELHAHYVRGLDKPNEEELVATFWPDGVLGSPLLGGDFRGEEGIRRFFHKLYGGDEFAVFQKGRHWSGNTLVEVLAEDRVKVFSQFLYFTDNADGIRLTTYGDYSDVVVKRNGEWRFERRDIQIESNHM